MKWNVNPVFSRNLRRMAIAIVVTGSVMAPAAYARAVNNQDVVPPSDLPGVAPQTGDAMFLHETADGRTLLYIERNQGAELAILDVTDPRHVKDDGGVNLTRRPAVERPNQTREQDVELGNAGAG